VINTKKILGGLIISLTLLACNQKGDQPDPLTRSWEDVVSQARGTEVTFYMWGGDDRINQWVDQVVGGRLKKDFDISLKRVPMDASLFVNKLLTEKQGSRTKGSIDLLWINGENFKRAREEGLLYGPYRDFLPNNQLINPETGQFDFGFPTEGYEVPYGRAQFVWEANTERVSSLPQSLKEVDRWIKAHPGRFTYPSPPDFTGSAFLRNLLMATVGGSEVFQLPMTRETFEEKSAPLWTLLDDWHPYMWSKGAGFPGDKSQLDLLFIEEQVDFNFSYTQSGASGLILQGRYPQGVDTFVLKEGTPANTHFTAIPFNAPNKAGALVLSNVLLEPQIQLSKNDPALWGDFPVLDMNQLDPEDRKAFEALDLGPATLSHQELDRAARDELDPYFVELIEEIWNQKYRQ